MNASLGFWLPPATEFGNMQNKYFSVLRKLDVANAHIISASCSWQICRSGEIAPGAFEQHAISCELAVYFMRRVADDLIAMRWLLTAIEETKKTPKEIKIDCIGELLNDKSDFKIAFKEHLELLKLLNEISNAFKHSFALSDSDLCGAEEPRVLVLDLKYNRLASGVKPRGVSLSLLADKYSAFFDSCSSWLRQYSARNMPGASP